MNETEHHTLTRTMSGGADRKMPDIICALDKLKALESSWIEVQSNGSGEPKKYVSSRVAAQPGATGSGSSRLKNKLSSSLLFNQENEEEGNSVSLNQDESPYGPVLAAIPSERKRPLVDFGSDTEKISPIKKPFEQGTGMMRSRTFADIKQANAESNSSMSRPIGTDDDSRISLGRKEKMESGSRDINDRLAALNDNWTSIKKNDLETIKEYKPGAKEPAPISGKLNIPSKISATVKVTGKGAAVSIPIPSTKDSKASTVGASKPTSSNSSTVATHIRPRGNSGTVAHHTAISAKSPTTHNTGLGMFDINKAFEELESIKTKMITTKTRTPNVNLRKSGMGSDAGNE